MKPTSSSLPSNTSRTNRRQVGQSAPGSKRTGATRVMRSSLACGRSSPVLMSMVPFRTFNSSGSGSSSSGRTGRRGMDPARLSAALTEHGRKLDVWHYRLFCDPGWQPIKPRGEVYSRELTEAGWKSYSDLSEEHRKEAAAES